VERGFIKKNREFFFASLFGKKNEIKGNNIGRIKMSLREAKKKITLPWLAVILSLIASIIIMSAPVVSKAETYCLTADVCFTIPNGFLLVDKALSDNIAKNMKSRFPGTNIGFYANLYDTFYLNKIQPSQRLYIASKKTGNLFLVFSKMNSFQKSKFPKEVFTSNSWSSEGQDMNRIRTAMIQGMRDSKGLSQGGMSMNILEFNFSKKYMLIKRTSDITEARIKQAREAGIPIGTPGKVGADYVAFKFGKTDCAILMYFGDPNGMTQYYVDIFKNMLSDSKD
jgi:hypothetical protein